ncbi:MAG: hypothetical protein AABY04_01530, partial [Candidatus Micrarchaeota archaeon]
MYITTHLFLKFVYIVMYLICYKMSLGTFQKIGNFTAFFAVLPKNSFQNSGAVNASVLLVLSCDIIVHCPAGHTAP